MSFEETLALPTLDVRRAWIITYTGLKFYHLNPQPDMVTVEDIAHSLSQLCRWTGHSRFFYSVAQHSVYASQICPPEDAFDTHCVAPRCKRTLSVQSSGIAGTASALY